jgi:predicted porin
MNSHLGPVEVDFSHGEKRFDAGGDKVLFDTYTQVGTGSNFTFPAGVWPHNLISDLAGSSNTLKLHTSYAGGLVLSGTLSSVENRNEDSGAKTDYLIGGAEATWVPMPQLAFAVKYRHKEIDPEAQGNVPFPALCSPSNNYTNNYTCLIKPTLSSISDTVSATARYRVVPGVILRAEYRYEDVRRGNFEEWFVPQSTQRNIVSLWADMRIVKNLNLRLRYIYKDINDPEINVEPDRSNEAKASLSWIPAPWVNTLVSYRIAKEKRNNLNFVFTDPTTAQESLLQSPNDRDVKRDQFLGSLTFLVLKDLSLTASYSYMHDRISEDLAYNDAQGITHFDQNVPQTDMAQTYAIDAGYLLNKEFSLHAGFSHTVSSAGFFPADPNIMQPLSIASFNAMKTRETVYSLSGEYRFRNGYAAGIQYRYTELQDALNNPYDDVTNGRAHIAWLTVTKRW